MTRPVTLELQASQVVQAQGLPHLTLQLDPQRTVALPLGWVQETLVVPSDRLTLLPNVHLSLMGLLEHRSQVFWVLDLPQLLGFSGIDGASVDYHLAILRFQRLFLGLAVYRIGRVVRFPEAAIRSPLEPDLPLSLVPYLCGFIQHLDEALYVLNPQALLQLPSLDK